MAVSERSVVVRIKAEVNDYKRQMREATKATDENAKAIENAAHKANAAYDKQIRKSKQAGDDEATARAKAKKAAEEAATAYEEANQRATTGLGKMVQSANEHEQAWTQAGTALLGFGAIALTGVGLAIKAYADFDKQMSSVQSATLATGSTMDQLRAAAINAGADTAYSAVEAGQAIEEMSKAGIGTADILNGGLAGALSLAAAGELEVADAAEIAATAITQFSLKGSDLPHVADLLAAGAGKAQGSVADLGLALEYVGPVAAGMGITIEESVGALAMFASNGILAEKAGTGLRGVMMAMTSPSKAAKAEMDALGISLYDAEGNFLGLENAAGQLQAAYGGMSDKARDASLGVLFGNEQVTAARILYKEGALGVAEWTDAVNASGFAAATAAAKQNNLAGDIEKLGGSLDSVFLKSASGANTVLRDLVQSLEGAVDWVGTLDPGVLQLGLTAAAAVGGVSLLAGGFLTLFPRTMETIGAVKQLTQDMPGLERNMGRAAKAAGVLGAGLGLLAAAAALSESNKVEVHGVEETTQAILEMNKAADTQALDKMFAGLEGKSNTFAPMVDGVTGVGDALREVNDMDFWDRANKWQNDVTGIADGLKPVREQLENLDTSFTDLASNGGMEAAAAGFAQVAQAAKDQGVDLATTAESFPEYINHLRDMASASGATVTESQLLQWAISGIPPAAVAAAQASAEAESGIAGVGEAASDTAVSIDDMLDSMFAAGLATMDARTATAKYEETLRDAKKMADDIAAGIIPLNEVLNKNATDFDLSTEAGAAANDMFQQIAQDGIGKLKSAAAEGAGQEELQKSLSGTYDSLVRTAEAFGLGEEEAAALAASILGVPEGVNVDTWIDDEAKRQAGELTEEINGIPTSKIVTISDGETVADVKLKLSGLHQEIQNTPDKQITITEPMSPAIITGLQALGYTVTTLPDGTVQVSENGADATGAKIDGVASKYRPSTVTADAVTEAAEAALNHTARDRTSSIWQTTYRSIINKHGEGSAEANKYIDDSGMFRGGKAADLPGFALGGQWFNGRLPGRPPASPFEDNLLAVTENGDPFKVRSREWIINERSSDKYDKELRAINNGTFPKLAGYYTGGRAMYEQPAATFDRSAYATITQPAGGDVYKIDLHNVPMNVAQETAESLLFALKRTKRGGVYAR